LPIERAGRLSELAFIERLRALPGGDRDVELGIGDDCAIVRAGGRRLLLTTDALVEDVHFRWRWDGPAGIGRRAFAVNASDIAAMGGTPRFALLSLVAPKRVATSELSRLVRGFAAAARASGCALVGGNLSSGARWMISVTLVGEPCGMPLRRSGARAGDLVYVSGQLGAAALAREILLGRRRGRASETAAFLRPTARLELGAALARARAATAAIDVSDGLLQDLGHLCRASGVGAVVEAERLPYASVLRRLPRRERLELALNGGEDYELIFTVRGQRAERIPSLPRVPVTAIGRIVPGSGLRVRAASGEALPVEVRGFDHFRR